MSVVAKKVILLTRRQVYRKVYHFPSIQRQFLLLLYEGCSAKNHQSILSRSILGRFSHTFHLKNALNLYCSTWSSSSEILNKITAFWCLARRSLSDLVVGTQVQLRLEGVHLLGDGSCKAVHLRVRLNLLVPTHPDPALRPFN